VCFIPCARYKVTYSSTVSVWVFISILSFRRAKTAKLGQSNFGGSALL
jgi:hypothetical protein